MIILLDESITEQNEILIIGSAIKNSDANIYRSTINNLRLDILHDPVVYQYLNCDSLKKSFHYTQDHRETKNRFIEFLSLAVFESFIYINKFETPEMIDDIKIKKTLYMKKFLQSRYKSDELQFIWEKDKLLKWPSHLNVIEKSKIEEQLLSISDYTLGIFLKIYKEQKKDEFKRDYERIQSKIRFIKDYKFIKPFTKKNPFPIDKK